MSQELAVKEEFGDDHAVITAGGSEDRILMLYQRKINLMVPRKKDPGIHVIYLNQGESSSN